MASEPEMRKYFLSIACLMALCACGDDAGIPEEQIRAYVTAAELSAEARDVGGINDLIADEYSDRNGYDRNAVSNLFRVYFMQHQSLHLLTRIEKLSFPASDVADLTVTVGVLGKQSEDVSAANDSQWGLTTEIHRFRVQLLRQDGEWLATGAEYLRGD